MPDVIGVAQSGGDGDVRRVFEAMTASRGEHAAALSLAGDAPHRWLFGYSGAATLTDPRKECGVHVAAFGTVDDAGPAQTSPADVVHAAYKRHGVELGRALRGAFAAVVIDPEAQIVLLVNDVVGTFPTYWRQEGSRFAWGTSLQAVVRASSSMPTLDQRAAADYLHYGFLFGTRTLAANVTMVPAGSTVVYSWRDGSLRVLQHTSPASLFAETDQDRTTYLERVRESFNAAVVHASSGADALGLSLSGGLDSRAILSAVPRTSDPVRTYTVGVKLCADDVIAKRLSALRGTEHLFLELGDQYLRDFLPNLERMVRLTDGMYLSHGLTEMLALTAVQRSGIKTLLRGHCGELAKTSLAWPLHTDATILAMRDRTAFGSYYFSRVNYVSRGVSVDQLFTADFREGISGGARQSFDEALGEAPQLSPADLCSYLYLTQHHRRFTVPSIELFRAKVDVRMPFADERFLRTLFSGRPEWRHTTDIHQYVTGRNDARLLRVRNSNTGAPGSAGPLLEKLLDPVNSVLKRLNVPGYRHYHRFDAWMRTELLQSVEAILLDETTRRRGIYDAGAMRDLIDETRSGRADRAYVLQILLVMELWLRQVQTTAR